MLHSKACLCLPAGGLHVPSRWWQDEDSAEPWPAGGHLPQRPPHPGQRRPLPSHTLQRLLPSLMHHRHRQHLVCWKMSSFLWTIMSRPSPYAHTKLSNKWNNNNLTRLIKLYSSLFSFLCLFVFLLLSTNRFFSDIWNFFYMSDLSTRPGTVTQVFLIPNKIPNFSLFD